jgi:hypothetical protein
MIKRLCRAFERLRGPLVMRQFEGRRRPRARLWLLERGIDLCERWLHRGAFRALRERVERHERLAHDVARLHQETLAHLYLWRL